MENEGSEAVALVITGDLANEFLADSATVPSDGLDDYRLPGIGSSDLRLALIRGLDAGDRVVGIFGHHGLEVLQPYGLVVDHYLSVPSSFIGRRSKQVLTRKVAGDLLPGFVFDRVNVKTQIGSSTQPTRLVRVLKQNGYDVRWLRSTLCPLFRIEQESFLDRFIRAGRYRTINHLSGTRVLINGYISA